MPRLVCILYARIVYIALVVPRQRSPAPLPFDFLTCAGLRQAGLIHLAAVAGFSVFLQLITASLKLTQLQEGSRHADPTQASHRSRAAEYASNQSIYAASTERIARCVS